MLSGGENNDILIGGAGADYFNGDGGTDTASYATSTTAVTASLRLRAIHTGDAAGDIYVGIEESHRLAPVPTRSPATKTTTCSTAWAATTF